MDNNALAKKIGELRRREARLIKEVRHQLDQLGDVHAELCPLLTDAANRACDAGHLTSEVTTLATEPKEP